MEEKDKKSLINEIKAELDDLEQQLKQSGDEVKTTYQKKKKKIADLLKSYTSQLEEAGSDRLSEIKEDSLELISLLEADYDISYTDYDTESGKISNAIDSLEKKIKTLGSEAGKVKGQLEDDLKRTLGKFKTELDIQKAHFKGTKERAMNEYEDWKINRLKEMGELKEKLEQGKEVAEEKLDSFTAELSKSYDHFKQAFKNLW
jgi:ElaB/YqjD/DUF883 family membrane-anchored ribosome-binding protein